MMRLLGVELLRWRRRRAVLLLLVGALVLPALIFAVTAWETRSVSAAEVQEAEALVQQELDMPYMKRQIRRCERNPGRFGAETADDCPEAVGPEVEWYLHREPLDPASVVDAQVPGIVLVVAGLMMLAATTFVGADWASGSMSNQLLFEPRRGRIWWAKGLVVAGVTAVVTAVATLGFWVAVRLLAAARDIQVPGAVSTDLWATAGRGVLLAAGAALAAYALTMLSRSTVFTVSVMFALLTLTTIVPLMIGVPEHWLLHLQVAAVLLDGAEYYRNPPMSCFDGPRPPEGVDCREYDVVSLRAGATYLLTLGVLCVAASKAAFLRRDLP